MWDSPTLYRAGRDDWWRWVVLLNGEPRERVWTASVTDGEIKTVRTGKNGIIAPVEPMNLPLHREFGAVELVDRREWCRVVGVYADGGVIEANPSPHGGTWAWCHVNARGYRLRSAAGLVLPRDIKLPAVSNNVTEFLALGKCLRALPNGWDGPVCSDSEVTLARLFWKAPGKGLPKGWLDYALANLKRLGILCPTLLGGHPNRAELEAGVRADGKPVSIHNVWCDQECTRIGREFLARQRTLAERLETERCAA